MIIFVMLAWIWSFHLPHGCKTTAERGFKIISLSVSFLELNVLQRGDLWKPHFQKFSALVGRLSASLESQMSSV